MSKTNIKDKLKDLFKKFNTDPKTLGLKFEEDIKLEAEAKLQDGSSIYTSATEWAVGVDVYTKDEEGNPVPAIAGEYVMEDGTSILVGDDGMVAEMASMQDEEEEMSVEKLMSSMEALLSQLNDAKESNKKLSDELASREKELTKYRNEANQAKQELSALRKQPAASSVRSSSNVSLKAEARANKSFHDMTLLERIQNQISTIKN